MMIFELEKFIGQLLMPAGLIWLASFALALICWLRRQRGLAALTLFLALLYAVAGNAGLAERLAAGLEQRTPALDWTSLPPFDAVLVLGGGTAQDDAGDPELSSSGDRLFTAARLWYAGKAKVLVASGVGLDGVNGFRNGAQDTRSLWRAVGIPDQAILAVVEPCWTTRDEVKAYRRLQEAHGWRRVALVSSATHLPRAMALATKAGLEAAPLGANRIGRRRGQFQLRDLVPSGVGFQKMHLVCWEYLGGWLGW